MIIEFVDPGYNFGFMWWAIGLTVLGVILFFLPFFLSDDEKKIAMWPLPGMLISVIAPSILFAWGASDYDVRVRFETISELHTLGYENITLSGDRFTAATSDGEYFQGVLVDMRPESGYAYQVLEITELGD